MSDFDEKVIERIKRLEREVERLQVKEKPDKTGWIPVSDTWTYNAANKINVPSGAASIYTVGMGIRVTANSAVLHDYITKVQDTLLTVAGDTLTEYAFSAKSYTPNPATAIGFPAVFDYTPTFTGFSTNPTYWVCQFSASNGICIYTFVGNAAGVSNATSYEVSAPIAAAFESHASIGIAVDNDGIVLSPMGYIAGSQVKLYTNHVQGSWTASGNKNVGFTVTYRF